MQNTNQHIVGSFARREEAMKEVHRLKEEGYSRNDIVLYSNEENTDFFRSADVAISRNNYASNDDDFDDRTIWEQIKDAFSTESYPTDSDSDTVEDTTTALYPYRENISQGEIVILVNHYTDQDVNTMKTNKDTIEEKNRTTGSTRDSDMSDDIRENEGKNERSIENKDQVTDKDGKTDGTTPPLPTHNQSIPNPHTKERK